MLHLEQRLRLTSYLRYHCEEIAVPFAKEIEFAIRRRLETKANHLRRGQSWKKLQALLEAEAISIVTLKQLIKKLSVVSQELSGRTGIPVDETMALLLRLFIQEPVTSNLLRQVLRHVFGYVPSSSVLYRIYQIVCDIATVLPAYTLDVLKEKQKQGRRQDLFGLDITFVPLEQSEVSVPEVALLNDIVMPDVEIEDLFAEQMEDCAAMELDDSEEPEESYKFPGYKLHWRHLDDSLYEEMKICSSPCVPKTRHSLIPVSELDKVGQRLFQERLYLNEIASAAYDSLFSSSENIAITLPLGYDKTTIVLLAILSILSTSSVSHTSDDGQFFKVLYLMGTPEAAENATFLLDNNLTSLGIKVAHFTAETHFNKTDLKSAQIVVTTVSVWSRLTCTVGSDQILENLRLLVIDEMSWLQESIGPALETIVTRCTRQVKNGRHVRIVGFVMSLLSLDCGPTFLDMASFLGAEAGNMLVLSPLNAMLLPQVFVMRAKNRDIEDRKMTVNEYCCRIIYSSVHYCKKVVVFVNSDMEAVNTAQMIKNETLRIAQSFVLPKDVKNKMLKLMDGNTEEDYKQLCLSGYLVLHSGMPPKLRNFVRKTFKKGLSKFIVATSQLAGMLPNRVKTVIIKETDVYCEDTGLYNDVGMSTLTSMLKVATFPFIKNWKTCPSKVFIISGDKFDLYVKMLQNQCAVESRLLDHLPDSLIAEIIFGNVSRMKDCEDWFHHTYLYHRLKNKVVELQTCSELKKEMLVFKALQALEEAGMIRFLREGNLTVTELGYIANSYCVSHSTMKFLGSYAKNVLSLNSIVDVLSRAPLFSHIQVKESQREELEDLKIKYCKCTSQSGKESSSWKVSVLVQTHLSNGAVLDSELKCEQTFVVKEMTKLARVMFEICLSKKNALMIDRCLQVVKMVEKGVWSVCGDEGAELPNLQLESYLQPISRTLFQVVVYVTPMFLWKLDLHGTSPLQFWLWVEDSKQNFICNHTCFRLSSKVVAAKTCVELQLSVAAVEPFPVQLKVCAASDKWPGNVNSCNVTFTQVLLPKNCFFITGSLDLQPLPVSVLQQKSLEQLYSFRHFSSVITQAFHSLYHSDCNMMLTAASSQDRAIAAELAIFRAMNKCPGLKVVYLTLWENKVKERLKKWQTSFTHLDWKLCSLSGNFLEDMQSFITADIVVATASHWEQLSRAREVRKWMSSSRVSLVVVDELQAMDTAMEVAITRLRMTSALHSKVRLVALSRAVLADMNDIANFLGIPPDSPQSVYNFRCMSAAKVQVVGFTQKQYSVRMMAMSQTIWDIIQEHLPAKKFAAVLVPTRKQVLLTAQSLRDRVMACEDPIVWLECDATDGSRDVTRVQNVTLRTMLECGIGMFHAGMSRSDFEFVQHLVDLKMIRVVILSFDEVCTTQLNSHLLIVKGTERYSITTETYVDIPVPEIADKMYACSNCWKRAFILTWDFKRNLYQTYFQDVLLLESRLLDKLPEHFNNEIVAKSIESKGSAVQHLSQSYLGQRLVSNPCFYLGSFCKQDSNAADCLLHIVQKSLETLASTCLVTCESGQLYPTFLGVLSSSNELSHYTIKLLNVKVCSDMTQEDMMLIVAQAPEFKELQLRIGDVELNSILEEHSRWKVDYKHSIPSVMKVFLLLQSHFSRLRNQLANFVDYGSDVKKAVATAYRIMHAVFMICCSKGWLKSALQAHLLLQMLTVGSWYDGVAPFLTLPHVTAHNVKYLITQGQNVVKSLSELQSVCCRHQDTVTAALQDHLEAHEISEILNALGNLPTVSVHLEVFNEVTCRYIRLKGSPVRLFPGKEYTLLVRLSKTNANDRRVCEEWTCILGLSENLLAAKTIKTGALVAYLTFTTPPAAGDVVYTLYVMPKNYVGLNQQFNIHATILQKY
ncbi:activating signal cointegrator 1 complex subunit 3-like isoform X2 [Periplaneta americana]|uniref:activating signal cointegrator 1 complex subunit 3-like isoform X2 n=1 Tax=Periplaneta americana TaxID=6978 RepID=UPI0037E935D9